MIDTEPQLDFGEEDDFGKTVEINFEDRREDVPEAPNYFESFTDEDLESAVETAMKENYTLMVFSRMDNEVIKNQFIDLVERIFEQAQYVTYDGEPVNHYERRRRIEKIVDDNIAYAKEATDIGYLPPEEVDLRRPVDGGSDQASAYSKSIQHAFDDMSYLGNRPVTDRSYVASDREVYGSDLTDQELVVVKGMMEAHEKGHVIRAVDFSEPSLSYYLQKFLVQGFDEARFDSMDNYLRTSPEILERMSQLKNYFGFTGTEVFTHDHLEYARAHYIDDIGYDNNMVEFLSAITPETEEKFLELINTCGI